MIVVFAILYLSGGAEFQELEVDKIGAILVGLSMELSCRWAAKKYAHAVFCRLKLEAI
jgi:hypothetical protein